MSLLRHKAFKLAGPLSTLCISLYTVQAYAQITEPVRVTDGSTFGLDNGETYTISNQIALLASGVVNTSASHIRGDNVTITHTSTNNSVYEALRAENGGQISLTNATITTRQSGSDYDSIGLSVSGQGSTISISGQSTIETANKAIEVRNGGSVSLTDASVSSAKNAVVVDGQGSTLIAENTRFSLTSGGISLSNGAELQQTGGHITTYGNAVTAIAAKDSGTTLKVTGSTIETMGDNSIGAELWTNTSGEIKNTQFIIHGSNSTAVNVANSGQTLSLINPAISLHGANSVGVAELWGGRVELTGGSITTYASNATGLLADTSQGYTPGQVVATDLNIINLDKANGVTSQYNGIAELHNVSVTQSGIGSIGLNALRGGTINAERVSITSSGENSVGVELSIDNGRVSLTDSTINMSGTQSQAIVTADPFLNGHRGTVSATRSVISTRDGEAVAILGGGMNLTLNQSTLTGQSANGQGIAILAQDHEHMPGWVSPPTQINVTANGSTINGNVMMSTANAGATFKLHLNQASTLNGAAQSITELTIDDTSRWNVTADSTLNALDHAGTIAFVPGTAPPTGAFRSPPAGATFHTITVNGDYTGTNGLLFMNAALGDDASASDKLIITGNTTGNTYVTVNNVGGNGALTGNGIELIQVHGNSNGTFTQQERVIIAGYEYTLYQGSLSNPADGSWYLRSVALPTPLTPDANPGQATGYWTSPLVGAYLGNQTAAVNMFSHSLHDRLGEPQFTETSKTGAITPSVWVRVIGNTQDSKAARQTLDLTTDTAIVQIGADLAKWTSDNGNRWHLGVMAGYGHSKTDVSHPQDYGRGYLRNAKGTVDGYSIGAYATWYGNTDTASGPYVDTWLQYGWFDNDVSASGTKTDSYKSRNLSASIEAGYAFTLTDNGYRQWMIEPQAQLIFNSYDVDDHFTAYGDKVRDADADADGLTTRVGARLYSRLADGNGVQPFIELNWLHGNADNSLQFSNLDTNSRFSHDIPKDRYEVKAGLQAKLSKNWHGWASVGWQTGNHDYQRLEGLAGVKYVW